MKKNRRIIISLVFLIMAVLVLLGVAFHSYGKQRKECFRRLVGYTDQIAEQICEETDQGEDFLRKFSEQLSASDLEDTESIAKELAIRGNFGMFSKLELLFPEDRLLLDDGTIMDVGDVLSFEEVKEKGVFISRRMSAITDEQTQIVRHYVPVEKDGEVAAILCGVIDLADLPAFFQIYDYGNAYNVFVIEAGTGMFIQDTWHDTLPSTVDDLGKRKVKKGYDWEKFNQSFENQQSDSLVFMSEKAGTYFYSYIAPVGVEDWMVMINVLEPVVFARANELMATFLISAALLLFVCAVYFVWILKDVRRENQDKEKQIRNISYMLAVEKQLFDAHLYPKHFVQALKQVAEYLSAEASFVWMIEETWVLKRKYWHFGRDFFQEECGKFKELYPDVFEKLEQDQGILINGKNALCSQFKRTGSQLADRQMYNLMLLPIYNAEGKIAFVLGACNVRHRWESLEPLQQVALSFSMTINHYESYYTLQMMGTTDLMTGVWNRNSYHEAIEAMRTEKPETLGCVYIDVNGLHEINNYLGHKAGDQMLRTIADALKKWFPDAAIYRIGGDEFVVFRKNWTESQVKEAMENARREMRALQYELSVGIVWAEGDYQMNKVIETAEKRMRRDKEIFYNTGGKSRNRRQLNEQMERMISEKQEAEAFLSVLEPEFQGVYFVNLDTDEVRHLFVPGYFEDLLKAEGGSFSKALCVYAHRYVVEEDISKIEQVIDYDWLKAQLDGGTFECFTYSRKDGVSLLLRIIKLDEDEQYKTQWIFKTLS